MLILHFGKVVDVQDPEKKNRLRVSIPGFTDEIPVEFLPWYFPFYGQDHLPIVNDIVPIFILNDNFTHGFYNHKIDLESNGLSGTEYENYVELYKRLGVYITYKESEGWFFVNKDSNLQIEEEIWTGRVKSNQIRMVEDRIDLGHNGPAMPLGDKTVIALQKQVTYTSDAYNSCIALFETIKSVCNSMPLKPIKIALTIKLPIEKAKFPPIISSNRDYINQIQSLMVFIQ